MKKWIFVLSFIIFLIFAGYPYWKRPNPKSQPPSNVLSETDILPSPSPSAWPQSTVVNIDEIPIRISWAIVEPKDVELYSNLKEQQLSEKIKVDKSCSVLVSGGFYSQENTHLGLFLNNFETISEPIQSALLNGFVWINADNKITINTDPPTVTPRLGLQSGPLLILNEKPLPLAIKNDQPGRRIVAGITSENQLAFMVFYRDQTEYEGPMLGQLPEIVSLFEKQTGIDIADAINLDGGSASVFISNYDRLSELSLIGSYFCIK